MTLLKWGHSPEIHLPSGAEGVLARVIEEQKSNYTVVTERGFLKAQLSGKLLHPAVDRLERPVVGDWVHVKPLWNEQKAVIQEVLPRRTLLKRRAAGETLAIQPLAANVDIVFVVSSLNRDFNPKRIERYLTIANSAGAHSVVLLTKADLEPVAKQMAEDLEARVKVPCLPLSILQKDSFASLKELLKPNQTVVLVGSSGVGKSTLVNLLLGREEQSVANIREDDDRGRHTTTSRRLIPLENGCLLIDTPGLREIQLDQDHVEGLDTFEDIEALAKDCKFHNCRHQSEPGCRVKSALEAGEISSDSFENYQKILKEVSFQERKNNKALQAEEKKKWKKISKSLKEKKFRT